MRLKIISDIDSGLLQYLYNAFEALKDTTEDVEFDITSYGGDVFAGLAICEKIKEFQELGRKFTAYIYGIAASAAADIALCCDYVEMAESSSIMVHSAKRLDGKKDRGLEIANAFQLETIQRRNPDFKPADLKQDQWFTAYEALQAGLIDGVFNVSTNEIFKEAAKLSNIYLAKNSTIPLKETVMEEEQKKEVIEEQKEVAEDQIDVSDLIERISERLKFIEDRLDAIEKGGEKAECGERDERQAKFKALYDKLGAICKPAQRQEVIAKETTPEEDMNRFNAMYPNLNDIAKRLDR